MQVARLRTTKRRSDYTMPVTSYSDSDQSKRAIVSNRTNQTRAVTLTTSPREAVFRTPAIDRQPLQRLIPIATREARRTGPGRASGTRMIQRRGSAGGREHSKHDIDGATELNRWMDGLVT